MKNIKLFTVALVLSGITFFISCDSRTLQDLKPAVAATSVSYTNEIKPILDNKCINCHAGGNTFPDLDTYDNVVNYQKGIGPNGYNSGNGTLTTASLLCSVQSGSCTSQRMPKGGAPLSDASITEIKDWIENNYKP
ncbi:MAG: hypothetical protein WCJ62_06770 [Flavobacterium sp.]